MVAVHLQIKKVIITPYSVGIAAKKEKQSGFPSDYPKRETSVKLRWNFQRSEASLSFLSKKVI